MPIYELMRLRDVCDDEMNMSIQLALHGAPIIKGIKMANLITVTMKEVCSIDKILQGTNISYRILKSEDKKAILYLYREEELAQYIFLTEVSAFLQIYGYIEDNIEGMLQTQKT